MGRIGIEEGENEFPLGLISDTETEKGERYVSGN